MQHRFNQRIAEAWPPVEWADVHVVAAVSGGADSVAMLRSLAALKQCAGGHGIVYAAHVNHHLRGADATADQTWLESLCLQLGVPLEVIDVDVAARAMIEGDGWEAAAREARYTALRATAQRLGARFVAVGHTADDQVETVLHHILRGTGLAGLAGMKRARALSATVAIVRPLIDVGRRDVLKYLADIGQPYRTDASNADARFTRNRLRHELVPLLREQFNTEIDAVLLRLAQQAAEAHDVIAGLAADLFDQCVEICDRRMRIDCRPLAGEPPLVVRELCKTAWCRAGWPLQSMGFQEWQGLAQLAIGGERAVLNLPGNIRAEREQETLVLRMLNG